MTFDWTFTRFFFFFFFLFFCVVVFLFGVKRRFQQSFFNRFGISRSLNLIADTRPSASPKLVFLSVKLFRHFT